MLPRVFEMFTQLEYSLERSQGGLGIGLALARRLIEMHGGTLTAHSGGPGQGSEFVVRLPVVLAADPSDAETTTVAAATKIRILVVDDNRDSVESLAMLLRLTGHEVHTAGDGAEAVRSAVALKPDLILLDIGLPKMNGYEAARRIREALGDGVMLIALTGWGQDEDRRRSKEAGFDHHLTKPLQFDALQQLLAEMNKGAS
jgi:CheY-like chemotaxis protein